MSRPDDEIFARLRAINRHLAEHSKQLERQSGLTLPQWSILMALSRADGALTLAELSDAVFLSAPTTSRIVERLVRSGEVQSRRSKSDRRQVRLSLTPAGLARCAASPALLGAAFASRLQALPSQQQQQLIAALEQLAAMMA